MLSSWLGRKSNEEEALEGASPRTTPRPSSPTDSQVPRSSTDKPPKRAFPTAYTTPHDAVLAELQGLSPRIGGSSDAPVEPASVKGDQVVSPDLESTAARDDKSMSPVPQQPPRFASADVLLDPFDGTSLGVLIPHVPDSNLDGEEQSPSQMNLLGGHDGAINLNPTGSEAVWTHLSRVLDIQSEISKMHLEMENITGRESKDKRHKPSNKHTPEGTEDASGVGPEDPFVPPGLHRPRRQRAMSTVSTLSSAGEPDDGEEGINVPDEEADESRLREDEFAKLESQFEGRKDAIQDIMNKLNDLSKTLSEFHALQTPNIEFPAPRSKSIGARSPQASGEGEPKPSRTPLSHASASTSSRTYEWTQQSAASSSPAVHPLPSSRSKSDMLALGALPIETAPQKKIDPTPPVNSMDWEVQPHVTESPVSIIGSLKLPPEK